MSTYATSPPVDIRDLLVWGGLLLAMLASGGCLTAEGPIASDTGSTDSRDTLEEPRDTSDSPSNTAGDSISASSDGQSSGCTDGEERSCGASTGTCRGGTQTCQNGAWGPCEGAVEPADELCNGEDDDCDGSIDEELERSCGQSEGQCETGTETCRDGEWRACSGVTPGTEACNGEDDDCDGTVDEGNVCGPCENGETRECGSSTGACKTGTQTCENNEWGDCEGRVKSVQEICDGVDNDCNGEVDDLTRPCGQTKGICTKGRERCSGGEWGSCNGGVRPKPEECNRRDDDCDGQIDEQDDIIKIGDPCSTQGEGVCSEGEKVCNNGTLECQQAQSSSSETCDGRDNDCDGSIDEDLTRPCQNTQGICQGSVETCTAGQWECMAESSETCDGEDNDCDGKVDENITEVCNDQEGVCQGATQSCADGDFDVSCPDRAYGPNYEDYESSCGDGLDNDCDGEMDCADASCSGDPCNGPGTECEYDSDPQDATCEETACEDGKDNDGDGDIDCQDSNCDCYFSETCMSNGECVEQ